MTKYTDIQKCTLYYALILYYLCEDFIQSNIVHKIKINESILKILRKSLWKLWIKWRLQIDYVFVFPIVTCSPFSYSISVCHSSPVASNLFFPLLYKFLVITVPFKSLWRWYLNKNIMLLDIIHLLHLLKYRPVFI